MRNIDFAVEDTADTLVKIVRRLRAPDGCPWDKTQTADSLKSTLAEELAELIDAIDLKDNDNICEELGDVLMNLVFQAVLAEEAGAFDWAAVCRTINTKMITRHPHVFGDESAADVPAVMNLWAAAKAKEKTHSKDKKGVLARVPASLSALERASQLQRRAAKVGFDWSDFQDILVKLDEEVRELKNACASGDEEAVDAELGDVLFTAVNLARFRKRAGAEELLRNANRKFQRRFEYVENALEKQGREWSAVTPAELDELWQAAKSEGL